MFTERTLPQRERGHGQPAIESTARGQSDMARQLIETELVCSPRNACNRFALGTGSEQVELRQLLVRV